MSSLASIVRLRPLGPWRPGSAYGDRDAVDRVLHSDTLYSALTWAFEHLGFVDEWVAATAKAEVSAVRVSSCFPFVGRTLLVPVPRNAWPPPTSAKVRWKSAKFIPISLVATVLRGETPNEDRWVVDPVTQCLLPVERNGVVTEPFRISKRSSAPVDRLTHVSSQSHSTACLEFNDSAGLWCLVVFSDEAAAETWRGRVEAAFRLLADTGIGGERTNGWGRFKPAEFESVQFPEFVSVPRNGEALTGFWLWSLFQPAAADKVDWTQGAYSLVRRSGRLQSRTASGERKPESQLVEEGSVLLSESAPQGSALDVSPEGFAHPVYRAGFAVCIPVPYRPASSLSRLFPPDVEEAAPAVAEVPNIAEPASELDELAEDVEASDSNTFSEPDEIAEDAEPVIQPEDSDVESQQSHEEAPPAVEESFAEVEPEPVTETEPVVVEPAIVDPAPNERTPEEEK